MALDNINNIARAQILTLGIFISSQNRGKHTKQCQNVAYLHRKYFQSSKMNYIVQISRTQWLGSDFNEMSDSDLINHST